MGFTIKKVKKAGSSNKTIITPKNDFPEAYNSENNADGITPFIDRIYVTANVSDDLGTDMLATHYSEVMESQVLKPTKPSSGYKRAYRLKIESVTDVQKWPFYEYSFTENGVTRIRIDFVPVDLGEEGLLDLHIILSTLMPDGWGYFIKHGRVSRIDIAVDIPTAQMTDFYPLPAQSMRYTVRNSKAELQTIEIGTPKGNQTVIYDRKAKRIAQKKPWQNKEGVRIERRLRHQHLPLKAISQLANPFKDIDLIASHIPKPDFENSQGKWTRFICTKDAIGLAPALATLPSIRRQKYRAYFMEHKVSFWDPEALGKLWADYLSASGVADIKKWN